MNRDYVYWVRVAKNASTSIKIALLGNQFDPFHFKMNPEVLQSCRRGQYYLEEAFAPQMVSCVPVSVYAYMKKEAKKKDIPWETAFKFMVSRNPYDRFVSGYIYLRQKGDISLSIKECLDPKANPKLLEHDNPISIFDHISLAQTHNLIKDGEFEIDRVLRFENLKEDWANFCEEVGLPQLKLGNYRVTKGREHWEKYLDKDDKKRIQESFPNDFKYLGYEP